ncbi:hypothetical protein [Ottowia caeni]|uniref:hypothetical protein n=1 Tax=Ottowia caeni TaxID=2870339 RepID=UPI003D73111E
MPGILGASGRLIFIPTFSFPGVSAGNVPEVDIVHYADGRIEVLHYCQPINRTTTILPLFQQSDLHDRAPNRLY